MDQYKSNGHAGYKKKHNRHPEGKAMRFMKAGQKFQEEVIGRKLKEMAFPLTAARERAAGRYEMHMHK